MKNTVKNQLFISSTGDRHISSYCADPFSSWLQPRVHPVYERYGFEQVHYFCAISVPRLERNLKELARDFRAKLVVPKKSALIFLDMTTEGPQASGPLNDAVNRLASELNLSPAQLLVVSQNMAMWKPSSIGCGPTTVNWAFGNSFDWNARSECNSIESVASLDSAFSQKNYRKFLSLNNAHRPHRLALYAYLHHEKLLDESYFSFRVEVPRKGGAEIASGKQLAQKFDQALKLFPQLSTALDDLRHNKRDLNNQVDDVSDVSATHEMIWRAPTQAIFNSLIHIVTESDFSTGRFISRHTEKTLKPIMYRRPFLIVGPPNTLRDLRELGFKTFSRVIDESYDLIEQPGKRLDAILVEISRLSTMIDARPCSIELLQEECDFNWRHLYSGALQQVLMERHIETLKYALSVARSQADLTSDLKQS